MKKYTLFTIILLITAFVQAQQNYNLVIFTEEDSKFTLYLNNIQQHEYSESNVWIGDLNSPMYKAKIVFEDQTKEQLEKTIFFPEESSEVTYHIFEKKGMMKMKFFSASPLPSKHVVLSKQRATTIVTKPKYTETVIRKTIIKENDGDRANMDVKIGGLGLNLNIDINDDINQTQVYEETTVVTSTNNTSANHYVMHGYNGPIGCPWPMEESDFIAAKRTIASKDWDDTRLSLAKQIISSNCLFSDQVRDIINLIEWETTKLEFAKYAYSYTYDTGNYFKVSQAFQWESSVDELNNYISTNH